MNAFSYTNIFDTKGIEYLIIIAFLLLVIPFWRTLNKPVKVRSGVRNMSEVLSENILRIPKGLLFAKNHTWAHLQKSGIASIGLDDFLLHLTGQVDVIYPSLAGAKVSKGDVIAVINQDGKNLNIISPVSGEIQALNSGLQDNPDDLKDDPYGAGWLLKIKPDNWLVETNNFYLAGDAVSWAKKELERFKDFVAISMKKFSPEASLVVLQEGGELRDNPLSDMDMEVWNDFQEQFLENIN